MSRFHPAPDKPPQTTLRAAWLGAHTPLHRKTVWLLLLCLLGAVPDRVSAKPRPTPEGENRAGWLGGLDGAPRAVGTEREIQALVVAFEKALNKGDFRSALLLFRDEIRRQVEERDAHRQFFSPILPLKEASCRIRVHPMDIQPQPAGPPESDRQPAYMVFLRLGYENCGEQPPLFWVWNVSQSKRGWFIDTFSEPLAAEDAGQSLWIGGFDDQDESAP